MKAKLEGKHPLWGLKNTESAENKNLFLGLRPSDFETSGCKSVAFFKVWILLDRERYVLGLYVSASRNFVSIWTVLSHSQYFGFGCSVFQIVF